MIRSLKPCAGKQIEAALKDRLFASRIKDREKDKHGVGKLYLLNKSGRQG